MIDQGLQLLPRLGTILHGGANLVEKVQSLVDLALRIGRVGTLLRRHGLTGDASIAGVIAAIHVAVAIAPAAARIARRTGDAVADLTALACLLPPGRLDPLTALLLALPGPVDRLPADRVARCG